MQVSGADGQRLQALKQEEVVAIQARTVHVLDWNRLIRIGDFDASYLQIGRATNDVQHRAAA